MTKKTEKITKTIGEYESVVDAYSRNGFKIKSKNDKETVLVKKVRSKKWRTFNNFILIIPKLVLMCCTLFTIVFIYNYLHTHKDVITVKFEG